MINRCLLSLPLSFLVACEGLNFQTGSSMGDAADAKSTRDDDGDGESPADGDCDDTDDNIYSDAPERCDDVDNDCDGMIDDADTDEIGRVWMFDWDLDGYGLDSDSDGAGDYLTACDPDEAFGQLVEFVDGDEDMLAYLVEAEYDDTTDEILIDCNDENEDVNPAASEVCDGIDNDCDDAIDDGSDGALSTFFADSDSDEYGAGAAMELCAADSADYVANDDDCNDNDAAINPDATEVCDSADTDENCDGLADGSDATGMTDWYVDDDDDGYGDPPSVLTACDDSSGQLVVNGDDCDDDNAAVKPGATEICDDIDNNCDGSTDPDTSSGAATWYIDSDVDGYGTTSSTTVACDQPTGYAGNASDCDDSASGINPGATEICDSADTDEDCDSLSDDADSSVSSSGKSTFYQDVDLDGYGNLASTSSACDASTGWVTNSTDCNDADATAYPGATESCDGMDDDCDGEADNGVETTFYADTDSDGQGDATSTESACGASTGYVSNSDDCVDTDATVYLGADELCDGQDNDCDITVDEDAVDQTTWSRDGDGDGYGDPDVTVTSCDTPNSRYVDLDLGDDCDDIDDEVNPAATEVFNEYDDDCDELIDEGTSCATEIVIFDGVGEADSISGEVSDDASLTGDWYSPNTVSGVTVTADDLGGGLDWEHDILMSLCISSSGYVDVMATFADGSTICDADFVTVYAWMDDFKLLAEPHDDDSDGTCDWARISRE